MIDVSPVAVYGELHIASRPSNSFLTPTRPDCSASALALAACALSPPAQVALWLTWITLLLGRSHQSVPRHGRFPLSAAARELGVASSVVIKPVGRLDSVIMRRESRGRLTKSSEQGNPKHNRGIVELRA